VAAILNFSPARRSRPTSWTRPRWPPMGDAQGGFQRSALKPLLRGEPRHRCVPAPFAGTQRASGVGGTARPGFPPQGETGKGEFRCPCCRRHFALAWRRWPARWWNMRSLFFHVSLHYDHQTYRSIRSFRFPEVLLAPPTPLPCFYPHSQMGRTGPGASWGPISSPGPFTTVTDLGCWALPST